MPESLNNNIEKAPNPPRIAIIEDQEDWINEVKDISDEIGSEVISSAQNYQEAIELIDHLGDQRIGIVLLDDGLGKRKVGSELAEKIKEKIEQEGLNIRILSFSDNETSYGDEATKKADFLNRDSAREIIFGTEDPS